MKNIQIGIKQFFCTLNIGNVLMFLILLCLARQYCWIIPYPLVAWCVSIFIALLAGVILDKQRKKYIQYDINYFKFFAIVGIPLILFYLLRATFPDMSGDWYKTRHFWGLHALTGAFTNGTDTYFGLLFNLLPDMFYTLFVEFMGMRLSNSALFFVCIWLAIEIESLLKNYISSETKRYAAVLFVLCINNLLFFSKAMSIDIIALPCLIHIVNLVLHKFLSERRFINYIAFLSGLSLALKFTNIIILIPIWMILLFRIYKSGDFKSLSFQVIFYGLIPIMPFSIWSFFTYNDPFYPLLSPYLNAPYWDDIRFSDRRWGPLTLIEKISWPVYSLFLPERVSEFSLVYSRIPLGMLGVILLGILIREARNKLYVSWIFLYFSSALIWSVVAGYGRYGVSVEIISGIICAIALSHIHLVKEKMPEILSWGAVLLCILCLLQVSTEFRTVMIGDPWSGREKIYKEEFRKYNFKQLGHDQNIYDYLSPEDKILFDDVDVWLNHDGTASIGMTVAIKDVPVISYFNVGLSPVIKDKSGKFDLPAPREKIEQFLDNHKNDNFYTLVHISSESLPKLVDWLYETNLGLYVDNWEKVTVPFYGNQRPLGMYLVKLKKVKEKNLPTMIDLSKEGEYEKYVAGAWSEREDFGLWMIGQEASVFFPISDERKSKIKLSLQVECVVSGIPRQRMQVSINGHQVAELHVEKAGEYIVELDKKWLSERELRDKIVKINFKTPDAKLSDRGYERVLSIGLSSMRIEEQ